MTIISSTVWGQEVLPRPERPLKAEVGRTFQDSKPGKIAEVKAPKGAPNIVIVLLDDVGFGASGTFGGPVPTPVLDRLANQGLRYNAFHTTALCSPTRAALLTGRNHHSVGTGNITELATGFDGYTSIIPKSTATVAEILRQNGYNTSAWGKWHNTPIWETSVAGPFDRWPTGLGFEEFYGFMGGESHQYEPPLYRGTTPVERPPKPNYTLNDDLADQAIAWMRLQKSIAPAKPFFVYFAPGATHAPHHVPKEWSDKYQGRFNEGWDKLREEIFARQKKLGVIPANAKLTPRPSQIPAWDTLSPERKKIASRLMEIYAGFLAQTDYEVGRLADAIKEMGLWDNTLFIYIVGDNGASGEGTPFGVFNEMSVLNGVPEDPGVVLKHLDELGGPTAYNHYPVGFAWAMDTPFRWTKQVASHFGGTRNAMVINWPRRIKDAGGLRSQFHHCIDIAPTILEILGLPEPAMVNGAPQKPMEGVSMAYTFGDAKAPTRLRTQYFEIMANRGLYHEGWMASAFHGRAPWEFDSHLSFDQEKWELYNVTEDFSQADDLAAKHPEKLRALQDLFWAEAARYNVLPLDDRGGTRVDRKMLPFPGGERPKYTYYPGAVRIPETCAPNTKNTSFSITAEIDIPQAGAQGVIAAVGGVVGGWSLYVQDGKPAFTYNYLTAERPTVMAKDKLPAGPATIRYEFAYDGGWAKGGVSRLSVNGKQVAEGRIDKTVPGLFSADETFDVGTDTGTAVGLYPNNFAFTGKIKKVTIDLKPKLK
ncbi:MAG: arylsulfatase [Deltaproteobacteria bacterium]|nr:MAG: arylsulfatase [Deltaproteobacteria bacterium]